MVDAGYASGVAVINGNYSMKVLITGGAGFIGSRTAAALVARGHAVTVLDNFLPQVHGDTPDASPTWQSIRDHVETVHGDVRDGALLARLVPKHDAIVHLAAETGTGQSMYEIARYCDVNVQGTAALLEAIGGARGVVSRLVVASSRSIYGEGCYLCSVHGRVYPAGRDITRLQRGEFDPVCPICGEGIVAAPTPEDAKLATASIYAATKLAQESLVLAFATANGIAAFALRYQNVYGDGQSLLNPYTGILSIFSREMLAGNPIEIFEDGYESRDFVHVDDIAAINVRAVESDRPGCAVMNVGSGKAVSVRAVVDELAQYDYHGEVTVSGRFRAGDIRHNFADLTRLRDLFGVTPTISFASGIARFADWVREQQPGSSGHSDYRRSLDELAKRGLMMTSSN